MAIDGEQRQGRSTLGTIALVVGVVVVVWFLLGLLHVIVSLVWGAVEILGVVALVLLVGWLLFRRSDD